MKARPPLTLDMLETRMYEDHTREERGRAVLVIGVQSFDIETSQNNEEQPDRADWYRRQVARALARLVRKELEDEAAR